MADNSLQQRGKELEEAFFQKHNQQLLEKLKSKGRQANDAKEISASTGITDAAVLTRLVALNFTPETLSAFALYPLVEVAWADGVVDDKEKRAVLQAAAAVGIHNGSVGQSLLEGWLTFKPAANVQVAWDNYARALSKTLTADDRDAFRKDLVARARHVAEATGGILGMGNKVSAKEKAALEKIEAAFS